MNNGRMQELFIVIWIDRWTFWDGRVAIVTAMFEKFLIR